MVYAPLAGIGKTFFGLERGLCRGVWWLIPVLEAESPMRVNVHRWTKPADHHAGRLAAIVSSSHEAEATS